jgi:hypothetical protein
MLIVHGTEGSAKSTFLKLLKKIVDPSKPELLTIHDSKSEFIQQLAHNYFSAYDNIKYNPKWLSDEACKAITGIGQTKRKLYSDDEDIVFEYKHCLGFNGINAAFSDPDVLNRSVLVELLPIDEENRKTEREILDVFNKFRPSILKYIFDILARAISVKESIKIDGLPRMADSALWGEAISISMGNKNGEFIKAYYNNIGFQNSEVIDSNPLAFAVKKLVEIREKDGWKTYSAKENSITLFEGNPIMLLTELSRIAAEEKIDTNQKHWPKEVRWLIKRIKTLTHTLQKSLGIKISLGRDERNNSLIKIEKDISANSMHQAIIPMVDVLPPNSEGITPIVGDLTPENDSEIKSNIINSGVTGNTGDKFSTILRNETNYLGVKDKILVPPDFFVQESQKSRKSMSHIFDTKDTLRDSQDDGSYECYYCNDFPPNMSKNKTDYEKHVLSRHPGNLAYPSKADLDKKNIPAKGKIWEV